MRRIWIPVAIAAVALLQCAAAQATLVTVGPPLTSPAAPAGIGNPATLLNTSLSEPGANLSSPVNGTIIRWQMLSFVGGPWRLRVLTPVGGVTYVGSGTSASVTPAGTGLETFSTSLPIKAGQTIAVDNANGSDQVGVFFAPSGSYAFFVPQLADGVTGTATGPSAGAEFAFTADVLPAPIITGVSPAKASIKGAKGIVIKGDNFAEVKGIFFGGKPAGSWTVDSENQLTAVAPPSVKIAKVAVTVTTVSGTAKAPVKFAYKGCKVPKLAGRKLRPAKKAIRKGGCRVGIVSVKRGATKGSGVVVQQTPAAGQVLAPGSKVSFQLG